MNPSGKCLQTHLQRQHARPLSCRPCTWPCSRTWRSPSPPCLRRPACRAPSPPCAESGWRTCPPPCIRCGSRRRWRLGTAARAAPTGCPWRSSASARGSRRSCAGLPGPAAGTPRAGPVALDASAPGPRCPAGLWPSAPSQRIREV